MIPLLGVVISGMSVIVYEFLGLYWVGVYLIVPFISLILFYPLKLIGVTILEAFYPLYAFGNLGEKIQRLTPEMTKQSQAIQKNLQKDMNFSLLSNGFDSLSSTFSKIISLVLKLEKIELKANKGNLFDSKKYINSLRSDIIEPLKSLRSFLEERRKKLIENHKEFSRIQIGASNHSIVSGGEKQSELTSKRSEILILELGENIEKLDEMMTKI